MAAMESVLGVPRPTHQQPALICRSFNNRAVGVFPRPEYVAHRFPHPGLIYGVSLHVLIDPPEVPRDSQGSTEILRRRKYAHRRVREVIGETDCWVSADPRQSCEQEADRAKVGLFWNFDRRVPPEDEQDRLSEYYLAHHLLAAPRPIHRDATRPEFSAASVPVGQMERIAECEGQGWMPCTLEAQAVAAGIEEDDDCEPPVVNFPDEYLMGIICLLESLVLHPDTTAEIKYVAAEHEYFFWESGDKYDLSNLDQALLIGDTVPLLALALRIMDTASTTVGKPHVIAHLRRLLESKCSDGECLVFGADPTVAA